MNVARPASILVPVLVVLALTGADPALGDPTGGRRWSWPTGHPVAVARPFDPPERDWMPGHRGVDLDVEAATLVRAPADGRVVVAGRIVDRGVVAIDHGSLRSTFEPLEPLVRVGDAVCEGDPIGVVTDGHSPGSVHWGVKRGRADYVDPLRMLIGRTVLKPWDGA